MADSLVSVDQVKRQMGAKTDAENQKIAELIDLCADAFKDWTGRQFLSEGSVATPVTHAFHYKGGRLWLPPGFDIAELVAPGIQVDTDTASPFALVATQYRLGPLPARWGVFEWIDIEGVSARGRWPTREIEITGVWGFPTVPSTVKQAAVITVRAWLTRGGAFATIDESSGEAAPSPGNVWWIPASARHMLGAFRRVPVAAA